MPGALLDAVIEIADSGVYVEPINIRFTHNRQSLQLRVANRRRPIISLLDRQTDKPDSLTVVGAFITIDSYSMAYWSVVGACECPAMSFN